MRYLLIVLLLAGCCSSEVVKVETVVKHDTVKVAPVIFESGDVVVWTHDSIQVEHDTLWRVKIVRDTSGHAVVSAVFDTIYVTVPGTVTTTTTTMAELSFWGKLRWCWSSWTLGFAIGVVLLVALVVFLKLKR